MKFFFQWTTFFLLGISSFACYGQSSAVKLPPEKINQTAMNNSPVKNENKNKDSAVQSRQNESVTGKTNTAQTAQAGNLREWIGKYPSNQDDKKFASFFNLPKVRKNLLDVLGNDGLKKLLAHFYGDDLIQEKAGFLVMLGTTARNAAGDVDYALVAIDPDNFETHVYFVDKGHMTGFGNTSGETIVPAEVESMISVYAAN